MLVPDSQACGNQTSSTTPVSASASAAAAANLSALQTAVGNAQIAANALLVANPWESWAGGMNLMKDIQRGNTQAATIASNSPAGGPVSQLPGLPPAGSGGPFWQRWLHNLRGPNTRGRSGNARSAQQVHGWDSRFVTGPGGKFATWPPAGNARRGRGARGYGGGSGYGGDARPGNCGTLDCSPSNVIDCTSEAADVVPSDGIVPTGTPTRVSTPPPNPALRTDQPTNIIVQPPAQYSAPPATAPTAPLCRPPARTGNICLDLKRGAVFQYQVSPQVLYRCSQLGYAGVPGGPCPVVNGPQIPVSDAEMASVPPYAAGMGMWTPSIAQPGAVPADCTGAGANAAGIPWWVWALGGVALLAVAGGGGEKTTTTRRVSATRQKRAA